MFFRPDTGTSVGNLDVKLLSASNDAHSVIRFPLNTESAMKKNSDHNTLVFITDIRANKHNTKAAYWYQLWRNSI